MEKNLFEIAARRKYRFPYRGQVSAEDLWDISVTGLDGIFKTLNSAVKAKAEESLLDKSSEDEDLENKIDIIRYIVSVKLTEKKERESAAAKKELKQKLLEIKARREDAALESLTPEELERELAKLN